MVEQAKELHDLIVSEIYKIGKKGRVITNREVLGELKAYGVTRPRVYRIIKALKSLEFLKDGDIEGESYTTHKISLDEKTWCDKSFEWLKEFDRAKSRARSRGVAWDAFGAIPVKKEEAEHMVGNLPLTSKPHGYVSWRHMKEKSSPLHELLNAIQRVKDLRGSVDDDSVFDEMLNMNRRINTLETELEECKQLLANLKSDYDQVMQEREDLRQENRTLYEKINQKSS